MIYYLLLRIYLFPHFTYTLELHIIILSFNFQEMKKKIEVLKKIKKMA